jgi:hypothetical protein
MEEAMRYSFKGINQEQLEGELDAPSCRSRQMIGSTCNLSIACVTGSWREELL